jgi:Radical SAM superfamily
MLQSVRIGFATNSSSSHSIVLHPNVEAAARVSLPGPWSLGISETEERYDYSIGAQADKLGLLAAVFADIVGPDWQGRPSMPAHEEMRIRATFLQRGIDLSDKTLDRGVYIDRIHLALPKGVPLDLWLDFLLDPRVTYHGANENAEHIPYERFLLEPDTYQVPPSYDDVTIKVDGDALVFFDAMNGTKLRWAKTPYLKSSTPELVDVKITDHCTFGCAFCYQGSTAQGQHAPLERVIAVFDQLADMGVFEVALGGGEPLAHPDFEAICTAGMERGLAVAFTTFDPNFARNPVLKRLKTFEYAQSRDKPRGGMSAIGVSVHGPNGIERLKASKGALTEQEIYTGVVAQSVIGATPMATTERLVRTAAANEIPLLLLGYKTTGRGDGRERPVDKTAVERVLRLARKAALKAGGDRYAGFRLGVDTAFLDRYGDLLDSMGIPGVLRSSPEGKFSMYVDAVANTCGPSSYCGPDQMEPVGDLRAQFATY